MVYLTWFAQTLPVTKCLDTTANVGAHVKNCGIGYFPLTMDVRQHKVLINLPDAPKNIWQLNSTHIYMGICSVEFSRIEFKLKFICEGLFGKYHSCFSL